MIKIKETVIVEGKYDKIKLESVIDGLIIPTNGFQIFRDRDIMRLIQRMAKENGIIVLTDSDGAGQLIRSKLSSCVMQDQIKHVYIPDLFGKEKRKKVPSKEGKLGVEAMDKEVLIKALMRVISPCIRSLDAITKSDLYELGFIGRQNSSEKRIQLQKMLDLPERMSANMLLSVLNSLYEREAFIKGHSQVNPVIPL